MAERLKDELSSTDCRLFRQYGQGPISSTPFSLIHEAFESFADAQPWALAIELDGRTVTYGELEARANELSNLLIDQGLRPRRRVVLVVQRSIPMVVAILAVLKCGCQYVPLDGGVVSNAALPFILQDTDAPFVLCLEEFSHLVRQHAKPGTVVMALDSMASNISTRSHRPSRRDIASSDGAYVIYTSGATEVAWTLLKC